MKIANNNGLAPTVSKLLCFMSETQQVILAVQHVLNKTRNVNNYLFKSGVLNSFSLRAT